MPCTDRLNIPRYFDILEPWCSLIFHLKIGKLTFHTIDQIDTLVFVWIDTVLWLIKASFSYLRMADSLNVLQSRIDAEHG